ncbi:MAG: YggS family pyridoxal phosphate-dependent enzyme [Burkholderiaceae bacterium]
MSSLQESLQANLRAVNTRITHAARAAGRDPSEIALVAVSKTFPAEVVAAALASGQSAFGENYVQEAVEKIARVRDLAPFHSAQWHFIGPIQSNKTRTIAETFDWVQSVDRLKVAERLAEQRPTARGPLNVLLQVNISGEASKSGAQPGDLSLLATQVAGLRNLRLRGLMAIPEPQSHPARQRAPLARTRQLFDTLRAEGHALDTLSMGMSADLDEAIAAGANMVRVGIAIFGTRDTVTV